MKTYSNSQKVKSRNNTLAYGVIIVCSLIILTLTVVLGITLSRETDIPVDAPVVETPDDELTGTKPEDNESVVTPPTEDEFKEPVVSAPVFCLPVSGGTVIRPASLDTLVYMPSVNMWRTHNGVDFSASENASVLAVSSGTVSEVTQTTLEGTVVTVTHENGLVSVYKSLSSATVSVGDKVSTGETIGVVGSMMTESGDGVHLHLEMSRDGELIDPLSLIDAEINK